MAIGQSLAERINRWQTVANNLKETARATPAVAEELAEMETLLAEARGLQDRQAQVRGQSRELTKQLTVIAERGDKIRGRLGAILQGKLGFTSEELVTYGFKPRKPPVRRRLVLRPSGQTQPPVTPAGTTPAAPAVDAQQDPSA